MEVEEMRRPEGRSPSPHRIVRLTLPMLASYILFGTLHELCHLAVAWWLFGSSALGMAIDDTTGSGPLLGRAVGIVTRAALGRYAVVRKPPNAAAATDSREERMILHSGWIFSILLALSCHGLHAHARRKNHGRNSSAAEALKTFTRRMIESPAIVLGAYVTALEALSTDLLGLTSALPAWIGQADVMFCFCGNFGLILLNSSWLNIDGGRTALDILEKMVTVTMMRGAQSGGVVTFEPSAIVLAHARPTASQPPSLKGVRSRVVNGKRTDLSKGVRKRIVKDNCGIRGNLRGWNKPEFNSQTGSGRLVRAFFGHTRFATSSKATLDGTHPHQWSRRRLYNVYSFGSSSVAEVGAVNCRQIGVENYISHNGDFDAYYLNGRLYDLEVIQQWLEKALEAPMPATVDSAAIAGVVDLLRTQGCFALSVRYALLVVLPSSKIDPDGSYPTMREYNEVARVFEVALNDMLRGGRSLEQISSDKAERAKLAAAVSSALGHMVSYRDHIGAESIQEVDIETIPDDDSADESSHVGVSAAVAVLSRHVSFNVETANIPSLVKETIDAFFDNDLLHTTRLLLENAKGSFGLMVSSTIDAHRQVCFAARGQTMSVAFYPRKGLVCYGSEQAAVKAGLNFNDPGQESIHEDRKECEDAVRLDLDDLGGEICLLDWGYADMAEPSISPPNRHLSVSKLMNDSLSVVSFRECAAIKHKSQLRQRLTLIERNEYIKPLLDDSDDPVLSDIRSIPRVCSKIQQDWHGVGLNRCTAWNLANCLRDRMRAQLDGKKSGQVDILVTGCEVSLWLGEQFVSDLQQSFPKLVIKSESSNKLLGLFGQEFAMPCTGFPISQRVMDIKDAIIIIISHSGGTFGPLACSNLLQSFSSSIFVVTSEWDTQIGKQLRSMYSDDLLSSRIFSTNVGVRPAEPSSVSVVATHQLLTNIFEHICITIISEPQFRHASGAIITERDLQTLERCNRDNLRALGEIVGVRSTVRVRVSYQVHEKPSATEMDLRAAGDVWSEHILEGVKAYIITIAYIIGTVTSGYPLFQAISIAAGLSRSHSVFYLPRFLDSLLYIFMPHICILVLRMIQGRNLMHRFSNRTVVIGDCPWVAQAAEAFLGKLFACSYGLASVNVLSGNPADHLLHRHTHRIVRGTLLCCGRPDGRLPALSSLEASACLSVNQASSIQSLGATCESITIGHNKSKLPLSQKAIFLKSYRPLFLSEQVLDNIDAQDELIKQRKEDLMRELKRGDETRHRARRRKIAIQNPAAYKTKTRALSSMSHFSDTNNISVSLSRSRQAKTSRTSAGLIGAYQNLENGNRVDLTISKIVDRMIKERQGIEHARRVFNEMDSDGDGRIGLEEFANAYQKVDPTISMEHLAETFKDLDINDNGSVSFEEFIKVSKIPSSLLMAEISVKNRDSRGLVLVQPSKERYFGEELLMVDKPEYSLSLSQSQYFAMQLYESRIASMQRFVAMTVLFHQMGHRVRSFWKRISFGLLGYRMDRTHSILRIATTASPVSGADVRERMEELRLMLQIEKSIELITRTWLRYKRERRRRHLYKISE